MAVDAVVLDVGDSLWPFREYMSSATPHFRGDLHHACAEQHASNVNTYDEAGKHMEKNIVRAKAFTVRSNNGRSDRFKGVVTLLMVNDHNKEEIESYPCAEARADRDLAQADADRLLSLKTGKFMPTQA